MNDVLFHLCRHCVGIMDGWIPYPAWAIANRCNISLSTARRRLRELKHGWRITDKAAQTEEYKAAWEQEKKICREIYGADMFPEED